MKRNFVSLGACAGCLWLCGTPLHAAKNAASMAGLADVARVPLTSTTWAEGIALNAPAPVDDVPAAQAAFVQQCQRDGLAVRWQANAKAYALVARDAAYMSAWRTSCDTLRRALPWPAARLAVRHVQLKSGALALDAPAITTTPGWYFVAADSARDLAALHSEDYVGDGTWLVRLNATSNLARARAVAALLPCHKLDPLLFNPDAYTLGDDPQYRVIALHGFQQTGPAALCQAIQDCSGEVLSTIHLIPAVIGRVPLKAIAALAARDDVKWIGKARPALGLGNDNTRAVLGANTAQAPPYNYLGNNVDVLVYDGGIADNHIDYSSRRTVGEPNPTHYHSTHVAGTVLGDGSASAGQYRGMAPAARLISYEYDFTGTIFYNNPGDLETNYFVAINTYGADIANNSIGMNIAANGYSAAYYGDYETSSILMDEITRGRLGKPFLSVWAAGNERGYVTGYRNISPPQCAKNTLVIGATQYNNNQATTFTSWGPLDDGRLKPDLSAPGYNVNSCYGTTAYQLLSGTSMASPAACGSAALLFECWRATHAGADPSPAMIKSVLINTTLDLGAPGPGFDLGYGLLQIVPALDLVRAGNAVEAAITHNAVRRFPLIVPATAAVVRATLAWSDPPASALAAVVLVNDLDLRLIDPNNRVFLPWVLDPNNPANDATTNAPDRLNNVEQVLATNLTPGVWYAEVRGFTIASGVSQTFALCANTLLRDVGSAGVIQFDQPAYCPPTMAQIELRDWDLTNQATYALLVRSTREPAGESVLVTQTSPGLFLGSLILTNAPPAADGLLSVENAATITVVYVDASDGMGGVAITNTATALIDLAAPVISGVVVTNVTDTSATILWQTDEAARGNFHLLAPPYYLGGALPATVHSVALTNLSAGTTYAFFLSAQDMFGNTATNDNGGLLFSFTTKLFMPVWQSTAELGEPLAWAATGIWHQSTRRPLAGARSWYCGNEAAGLYDNSISSALVSVAITVTTASASLRLREFISTESGYDYCSVQVTTNRGARWHDLRPPFSGSNYVRDVVLPLTGFTPGILQLRFLFTTDSSVVREGWYLDALQLGGYVESDLIAIGQSVADPPPNGDSDGFIEPGETIALRTLLFNGRATALTNLTGTLSCASPFVAMLDDTHNFGTVMPGVSCSNDVPFVFTIAPGATNGAPLSFVLACAADDGTVVSNPFTLAVTLRYAIAGLARDIADHTAITNAWVYWQDSSIHVAAANAVGAFLVSGLEPRAYTVWADADGYSASDALNLTCPPDVAGLVLELGKPVPVCFPTSFNLQLLQDVRTIEILTVSNAGFGTLAYTLAPSNNFSLAQGFDNAGTYRWIDSDTPDCPAFAWIDISTNGQVMTLGDDQISDRLPLAHVFPFYSQTLSGLWIGANGGIALHTTSNVPVSNATLPASTASPELIAPFWDDLNPASGGTIYFKSFADKTVVSYVGVKRYGESASAVTFQVILNANGTIRYQYLGMHGTLTSATIGWQGDNRSKYAQVAYNTSYVRSNLVVAIGRGYEWLQLGSAAGSVRPFAATNLAVAFDTHNVSTGIYAGAVTLYSEGGTVAVPATLTVVPEPVLLIALLGALLALRIVRHV